MGLVSENGFSSAFLFDSSETGFREAEFFGWHAHKLVEHVRFKEAEEAGMEKRYKATSPLPSGHDGTTESLGDTKTPPVRRGMFDIGIVLFKCCTTACTEFKRFLPCIP